MIELVKGVMIGITITLCTLVGTDIFDDYKLNRKR